MNELALQAGDAAAPCHPIPHHLARPRERQPNHTRLRPAALAPHHRNAPAEESRHLLTGWTKSTAVRYGFMRVCVGRRAM